MTHLYTDTPFATSLHPADDSPLPASDPDTHGLLREARRQAWQALLLGRFDLVQRHADTLERLAKRLHTREGKAFGLAVRGSLACLAYDDPARGKFLAHQAQAYAPVTASDKLALAWNQALVALLTCDTAAAQQHLGAALQSAVPFKPVLGAAHLVLHAMLYAQCDQPVKAVEFFALAWTYSMPEGGWLAAAPCCQQVARGLQQQLGMACYQKTWLKGETLPFQTTLARLMGQYTR